MEKKLPKNWVTDKLFNVVQPVGTNVKKYVGEKEYFSTGSISKEIVPEGIYDFQKKPSRANREVKLYDVLQARMKATNKSFLITENFENSLFSTGFMQFRSYGFTVLPKFIFYYLNSQEFLKAKDDLSTGATQQSINDANAKKIDFPLPPLPEQERIVAKLDLLFAQHEKMKIALEKIPQILKDFRQQILTQAVTGKLINPKFIGKLEDYEIKIITGPFGSSLHKSDYVNAGIPVINPSHILNGEIVPDERVTIDSQTFHKLSAWKLVKGDVILGRRGEMGRAAPFSGSTEMLCGTGSIILRSDKVNSQFLAYYLRSELCVKYLNENSVGSTMVNLNQGILKSLPIPIYTIKEQNEIVKKVEKLFLKSEIILNKYQKLKEKIDQFPQTILHKAFKGELVPQLPTDGDAKDLLKEILALKKEGKKN